MEVTRTFKWCSELWMRKCRAPFPSPHAHVCVRSVGAEKRMPECQGPAVFLEFNDLDPEAIRRTGAFKNDPVKGQEIIDSCFTVDHAFEIMAFVVSVKEPIIVVNCEAGVSRSAGVVLALRRHFGGDVDEVFQKAIPNVHVTSVLSRVIAGEA